MRTDDGYWKIVPLAVERVRELKKIGAGDATLCVQRFVQTDGTLSVGEIEPIYSPTI